MPCYELRSHQQNQSFDEDDDTMSGRHQPWIAVELPLLKHHLPLQLHWLKYQSFQSECNSSKKASQALQKMPLQCIVLKTQNNDDADS